MPDDLSSVLDSVEHTPLASGQGRTEGPLWHPSGFLTFVDLEGSRLLRWDTDGSLSVAREDTGEGNGCTLDRQGRLLMCEAQRKRVTRQETDGSITSIADSFDGKPLNRPNDVICRSDGTIFFTDPDGRTPPEERLIGFGGLFRISPDGQLHLGTDGCEYPNGLALSPDESVLYVAISRLDERCFGEEERGEVCTHRMIRAFDVAADGSLSNNRVFCEMFSAEPGVPDGMKVDSQGRVFCTGSGGVWVIDPSGDRVGIIRGPEVPRNVAFGGPDMCTLFTTPGDSLYSVRVKVPGISVV